MDKYRVTFDIEMLNGVSPFWVQLELEKILESYEKISNFEVVQLNEDEVIE